MRRRFAAVSKKFITLLYTDGTLVMNEDPDHRDANIALHGAVVKEYTNFDYNKEYPYYYGIPWASDSKDILNVEIDTGFAPTYTSNWFYNFENLVSIKGLEKLNTSDTKKMEAMFRYCYLLSSLDVSNFDTSNVTSISYMFGGCRSLTSLDVSNFNTSNITNMLGTFYECHNVSTLDVSN